MMISTKGRYALRLMADIAHNSDDGYISLKEVSQRQNISKKYLEQIVPLLTRTGLLRTTRGNKGGYSLGKPAGDITVLEVIRAAEGTTAPVSCLEYETNDCPMAKQCCSLFVWEGLNKVVSDYLGSVTVEQVAQRVAQGGEFC